jgi:CheY-like chemotaxis protein
MAKKILVIDDEELLTKTFAKVLERKGYDVYIAKNGEDACVIAEEEVFDLIIADIKMPGMDGIETIKRLRGIFTEKKVNCPPEIFITGFADEHQELEAKKLNPKAYILKPFDLNFFLKTVEMSI